MTMSGNGEGHCLEAREHYYELLCRGAGAVPEPIARHVEGCSFCQQEIRRLKDAIGEVDEPSSPSVASAKNAAVETLSRQFELLGEQVRCSHAKPFLPGLAAPSPQIRIPTPITVHVENCPQCAGHLAAIRELNLTAAQLARLGEFYSLTAIDDLPQDEWSYEQRARAAAALGTKPDRHGVLRCREVTTADLFDFVLPLDLDDATLRRAAGRNDAVAAHVRQCRACMKKAQSLHQTIYGIAERADSAVFTVYQCEKDAGVSANKEAPHRYPVDVWIVQDQRVPAAGVVESSSAGDRSAQQSPVPAEPRPWLLKGSASLAAAVVLVASLSFVMNAAQGVNFRGLRKSVRQAPNVCVKSFSTKVQSPDYESPDPALPDYELWLSRDLNKLVIKTEFTCEVADLTAKTRVVIDSRGNRSALMKMDQKELGRYRSYMDQDNLFANAPDKEELSEVPADSSKPSDPRLLAYEIVKTTVSGPRLWKVFIDPARQLPTKAEFFQRDSDDLPWGNPMGKVELTYPTRAEMEAKFRELATSK